MTAIVPRMRMSASSGEFDLETTFSRNDGSAPCRSGENVGRGRPSSILTILSECAVLTVCADLGLDLFVDGFCEYAHSAYSVIFINSVVFARFAVMRLMPCSLASWKNVRMVMPVPWALRQRSYCLSHSSEV